MQGIIVARLGNMSAIEIGEEVDFYKACGFRNPEGFSERATWTVAETTVRLFAKTKGKSQTENKYEFPPPVDAALYFGRCLLVGEGLTIAKWNEVHTSLMGGFEELKTETESDEEDAEVTKEGYEKDGFVVSDSELEEEPYV